MLLGFGGSGWDGERSVWGLAVALGCGWKLSGLEIGEVIAADGEVLGGCAEAGVELDLGVGESGWGGGWLFSGG